MKMGTGKNIEENEKLDIETTATVTPQVTEVQNNETGKTQDFKAAAIHLESDNPLKENLESTTDIPPEIAHIGDDTSKKEIETLENRLKRLQADFDNYRKRTQAEKEQLSLIVKSETIKGLLSVLDNFERALATEPPEEAKVFMEGFQLIHKQFVGALEKEGLKKIEAIGKEFDPVYHEAIMRVPSDSYENDIVAEELQAGYQVGDKIIRPTMVKVTCND
jgi:molecular chaperone GrpE